MQVGLVRHPDLPNVPLLMDLATNESDRKLLEFFSSDTDLSRSLVTTQGVPPDRVEALRRAFDATTKDPALISDLNKMGMSMGPMTGEEVQKLIASVVDMSPELLEKVRKAYPAEGN